MGQPQGIAPTILLIVPCWNMGTIKQKTVQYRTAKNARDNSQNGDGQNHRRGNPLWLPLIG